MVSKLFSQVAFWIFDRHTPLLLLHDSCFYRPKCRIPTKIILMRLPWVGEALEKVHLANLLHRDIKPENVIICDDGRVVLIDFGLTKKIEQTVGLGTRRLTITTRFGSDGYAPPEQYTQRAQLGTFTDMYALGATLYFLLTGEVPVSSTDRMYGVDLDEIQSLKPQVSRAVRDAVTWAMQVKENQRPQNLGEFLQALQAKPQPVPNPSIPPARTHPTSTISTTPATTAPAKPKLTPLVPSASLPSQWGRCSYCDEPYPLTSRQCKCGAMLPWTQPQVRGVTQISPTLIDVDNAEGLAQAIEHAAPGTTIRLLLSTSVARTFLLGSSLLIRKSLRIEGARYETCRILCHAGGYVIRLEGNHNWSFQGITFEHCGTKRANVIEIEGGKVEFHKCAFTGAAGNGSGLRVHKNTEGVVEDCTFYNNDDCGIELNPQAQILGGGNRFKSNKNCNIRHEVD